MKTAIPPPNHTGNPHIVKKRKKNCIHLNISNCAYKVVQDAALAKKWCLCLDDDNGVEFDVYWTDKSVSTERVMALSIYQRINHFPGMTSISRKNGLAMKLKEMHSVFPDEYNFFPRTWVLPRDWPDFKNQFNIKSKYAYYSIYH